jgi:hypothetical protein
MVDFSMIGEHTLTLAGVTTEYVERVRNITLPTWADRIAHLDDQSMADSHVYPIPEGGMDDLMEVPAGGESSFASLSVSNVVCPSTRKTTGFTCDRRMLLNAANTNNILNMSARSLEKVRKYWVSTFLSILNGGHDTYTSRDGKYLFAADHVLGEVSGVSNIGSIALDELGVTSAGLPGAPSPEALAAAAIEAIVSLRAIKNGPGDQDFVSDTNNSFYCLFPAQWLRPASQAFGVASNAQLISGMLQKLGAAVPDSLGQEFMINYACVPGLTAADTFFVFPDDTSEKPLLRRQNSLSVEDFGYDSEVAKRTGLAQWLVELYGGAAPFYFERIYRATLTAS